MPVSNTITAFYSFSPNTTIYSAQVNNNFDLFRGNLLPIDGSTTAFANNAYDLGSTSASWRNTYSTNLYLGASGTINVLGTSLLTYQLPATSGRLLSEGGTAVFKCALSAQNFNSVSFTAFSFSTTVDTLGGATAGAYVIKEDGLYDMSFVISPNSTTNTQGRYFIVTITKNGTNFMYFTKYLPYTGTYAPEALAATLLGLTCAVSDIIRCENITNNTGTIDISGNYYEGNHFNVIKRR